MGKKIKIDMTGVEAYGKVSEGQHVAKIVAAEPATSQGGNDVIKVTFEVTKGIDKGNRVIEVYPLTETALWKLKGLLVALGMKCDGKITLDVDKLVGKLVIIEVQHEEYNGNMRAKVSECKKLSASADEDDDTDDDDDEDDEDDDFDEDDEDEEEAPKKKSSKKAPAKKKSTPAKKKAKVEEDEDEDDEFEEDDDEDDEDEEPAPKKKSSKKAPAKKAPAKKAPAKKKPAKKVVEEDDDDEDDDEDWEEDDE